MRTVRLKSGGHVNVLEEQESPIEGEINFFSQKELDLAMRLGQNSSDPEAQKEFWKTLLEKKKEDITYSLLKDFPEVVITKSSVPTREFAGKAICLDTIEMLRGRVVKAEL